MPTVLFLFPNLKTEAVSPIVSSKSDLCSRGGKMVFYARKIALATLCMALTLSICFSTKNNWASAQSMGLEQAKEREELNDMKGDMSDVKSNITDSLDALDRLSKKISKAQSNEVHLITKEAKIEIAPGKFANFLTYNGKVPGPTLRVTASEPLRVVLHNNLKVPTSLTFHGLVLSQGVSGLPHKEGGLVGPGQVYAYQFIPKQSGTYWYHPQVNHGSQKVAGMYGALIVEPRSDRKSYDRDYIMMFGQTSSLDTVAPGARPVSGQTYFLVNGMTAPLAKPLEVREGERIRLRMINASSSAIPLFLSGHKMEIVSMNGSDLLEPHVTRDTITLNPSDRMDVEFQAKNPGVWSLASELTDQSTNQGAFPGGIACVIRYMDTGAEKEAP
jgi:FtsP/CotA-like multicopper oxidase with cupredoxin domain